MERFVIESPLTEEWLRTTFVDVDGQVFLPCGALDNELTALLCISHDGVPFVQHQGHIYAPSSWLAREYPRYAQTIETIADRVLREAQAVKLGRCDM